MTYLAACIKKTFQTSPDPENVSKNKQVYYLNFAET